MACTLHGQELTKAERRKRENPGIYSLVELAQQAPPELRSLGLRIAGSQAEVRDREWREELLEQAFEAGAAAHLRSPVLPVFPPEGPMAEKDRQRLMRQTMLNAGVDRLSLQSAAVRSMASINRKKAGELFDRLLKPDGSEVSCESAFVPDTSEYFSAASAAGLAGAAAAILTSPLDVAPALQSLSSAERQRSVTAFAAALGAIPANSRAWAAQLGRVTDLMTFWVDSSSSVERRILLGAWREYLATGLGGSQCAEVADGRRVYARWIRAAVDAFNRRALESGNLAVFSAEEQKPEKIEAGLSEASASPNQSVEEIHKGFWHLLFGDGHEGLSDAAKASAEWKAEFIRHLNRIENLKDAGIEGDVLWVKAQLIGDTIAIVPAGALRELAMTRYLALMSVAHIPAEDVAPWYYSVTNWIGLCETFGLTRKDTLGRLEESGHPWLQLVSRIEALPGGGSTHR